MGGEEERLLEEEKIGEKQKISKFHILAIRKQAVINSVGV